MIARYARSLPVRLDALVNEQLDFDAAVHRTAFRARVVGNRTILTEARWARDEARLDVVLLRQVRRDGRGALAAQLLVVHRRAGVVRVAEDFEHVAVHVAAGARDDVVDRLPG